MVREHYTAPDIDVQPIDTDYTADYTMCWGSDNSDRKQHNLEVDNCLREQGIDHYDVVCHPQSRYWHFQFIEIAVMLLCSGSMVALALFGARGPRRRSAYTRMSEMSKSI